MTKVEKREPPSEIDGSVTDGAGEIRELATEGWPPGYVYGATRYADVILRQAFVSRSNDLISTLSNFRPTLTELRTGGGGRTVFVKRFDDSLAEMLEDGKAVWGKQNISISKQLVLEGKTLSKVRTRGHEIDMFGRGSSDNALPGIAVEMEWNNKDPFFDRDLLSFQALHREGVIAVGVIVTRGPGLQEVIGSTIRSSKGGLKYGQSTTHWEKLLPRVNFGGGGECPLLLVGIEPERIDGIELALRVREKLTEAELLMGSWKTMCPGKSWREVRADYAKKKREALELMPPLKDQNEEDES